MNLNEIDELKLYRYETPSGFAVETLHDLLPVFDAQSASVGWHDLEASALNLYTSPHLEQIFQKWCLDEAARAIVASATEPQWYGEEANTVYVNQLASQFFDGASSSAQFYIGTTVEALVQFSRRCFGKHENRIVAYEFSGSMLLAGVAYLVSDFERETTEATAKDHTSHLEFLMLSRNHSNPSLFSSLAQETKRFGWRKWFRSLGYSNRASSFWSRFASFVPPCPCSANGFGAMI